MPGEAHVLVLDRDPLVTNLLGMLLEKDGYEVSRAASEEEAVEAASCRSLDAVILDVGEGIDGLEICRRLRRVTDAVILVAGPRRAGSIVVRAFQLGADDYLGKPYTYDLLASRLRACLGLRGRQAPCAALPTGRDAGILIDANHRRVVVRDGRWITLTRKEFELLQLLVENHDRVVSSDDILRRVWGVEYVGDRDLVKQFIYRLRAKLEDDPAQPRSIITVRGSGYAFEPPTEPSMKRLWGGAAPGRPGVSASGATGPRAVRIPSPREDSAAAVVRPLSRAAAEGGGTRRRPARRILGLAPLSAAAFALLLSVILGLNVAEASQGSIPGDRLYPLKIGLEGLQHALTRDSAEQCALHLEFARERVEEVAELVAEDRAGELPGALAAFEREMLAASWAVGHPGEETAGAASLRSSLEAEALRHDEVLRRLLAVAPEEARPGLEHALIVLNTGRGTGHALFIPGEPSGLPDPSTVGPMLSEILRALEETSDEGASGGPDLPFPGTPGPAAGISEERVPEQGYPSPLLGTVGAGGSAIPGGGPSVPLPRLPSPTQPAPGIIQATATASSTPTIHLPHPH